MTLFEKTFKNPSREYPDPRELAKEEFNRKYWLISDISEDGDMAGQFRAEPHELLKFSRLMYDKGQEEEPRRQKTGIDYVNDVLFVDEF